VTAVTRPQPFARGLQPEYLTVGWNLVEGSSLASWYLSATTLTGLALNGAFGLWWADPVAARVIAAFLLREAWEGRDRSRAVGV
jgi:hypothetical protein